MWLQCVWKEVIHIGKVVRSRLDGNVTEAIKTFSLLISVEGISAASNCFSFQHSVIDDQQVAIGVVPNCQNVPRKIEFPGSLDQSPTCLNLGRQAIFHAFGIAQLAAKLHRIVPIEPYDRLILTFAKAGNNSLTFFCDRGPDSGQAVEVIPITQGEPLR